MGSLFETLYDVLFEPQKGMRNIAEERNVGQALVVFLISILIPLWAVYFGLKAAGMAAMIEIILLFKIFGSMVMWIMGAAIWHLIAELFGGHGTAKGLFAALGFAHIPRIFIVPLWALIAVMPADSRILLMAAAMLAVVCWSFYLDMLAVKEVHQLSSAKAVLVIMMPLLIMGVLGAVAVVFAGSALMHSMWL